MAETFFKALRIEETPTKEFTRTIQDMSVDDLPDNDVLIRVVYSSLNYKDALSASGNKGVTRKFPHTPGIDAAGVVEDCRTDAFQTGEDVIVTSYDLGMNTPGGFGEYIRVPAEWVVRLPRGLSLKQSMIIGTAGFTAAMSVRKLTHTLDPDSGRILVTGATGGVGSMACAMLTHLGYSVSAVTGKTDTGFFESIGVSSIIPRNEFLKDAKAPLLKAQWAGVIDTVGGDILATAIKSTDLDGIVTCCGNVASPDLPITVFPFILRGITLFGIDSQHCPMDIRAGIWEKLAADWKFEQLDTIAEETDLNGLDAKIRDILAGRLKGRTIVKIG